MMNYGARGEIWGIWAFCCWLVLVRCCSHGALWCTIMADALQAEAADNNGGVGSRIKKAHIVEI